MGEDYPIKYLTHLIHNRYLGPFNYGTMFTFMSIEASGDVCDPLAKLKKSRAETCAGGIKLTGSSVRSPNPPSSWMCNLVPSFHTHCLIVPSIEGAE